MHDQRRPPGRYEHPDTEHDAMLHRYSDLQDRFRLGDGYTIG
jgi:hypothetical protein